MSELSAIATAERLRTLANIESSRTRLVSALGLPCTEHEADPGGYCWGSPGSGVQALCVTRYERGIRQPSAETLFNSVTAMVTDEAKPKLDFRHPNRHHMTPIRTAAGR